MQATNLNPDLNFGSARSARTTLLFSVPFVTLSTIRNHRLKREEIVREQEKKLKLIVKHSYDNVWYYHQLFKRANILPGDIKTIEDISKIPVSRKIDVRDLPVEKICAMNMNARDCQTYPTSGTSGVPMVNLWENKAKLMQFIKYYLVEVDCGVRVSDRQVAIGADWVTTHPLQRFGVFNVRRIKPTESLPMQLRKIRDFDPRVMVSYPSCANILAKQIQEEGVKDVNIRYLMTGGENLDRFNRRFIEEVYQAQIIDAYGANEVGGVSMECSQHSGYHIWGDCVIVEILRDDEPVSCGEDGEITVTNLTNFLTPFFRYNIQDLGRILDDDCSCNNHYPLMEILQGRSSDVIHLRGGGVVSALGFYGILNEIKGIKQWQMIQESLDMFRVKIVKEKESPPNLTEVVESKLSQALEGVEIIVELVDEIPKQRTGKHTPFLTKIR